MLKPTNWQDLPSPPPGRTGWPWTGEDITPAAGLLPRVTLVTPSFNQAAFLEETIRSVLLQGYQNLQYIVIDGGSTDGSVDILQKYAPWIDHWVSEPDRGQSDAIAKGLAVADGTWFNWLNSDDILLPGALGALVSAAVSEPTSCIAAGVTQNLRDGRVFGTYAARITAPGPQRYFQIGVNQPGSLLKLAAVRDAGGVRRDLDLTMDLDLWLRILLGDGPVGFVDVDTAVAGYRYHDASKTCQGVDVFALEEFALLFDLALQCEAPAAATLVEVRNKCSAARVPFPAQPQLTAEAVERAWLDRLLVSDSLLFRALRRSAGPADDPAAAFANYLDQLEPALQRIWGAETNSVTAHAMMAAQQNLGYPDRRLFWRGLRRSPSPSMLADSVRLLVRPWRDRRRSR